MAGEFKTADQLLKEEQKRTCPFMSAGGGLHVCTERCQLLMSTGEGEDCAFVILTEALCRLADRMPGITISNFIP